MLLDRLYVRSWSMFCTVLLLCNIPKIQAQEKLKHWQEGYLDIHHINTASGDATYFIFPDGTTMLFDLGAVDAPLGNPEYFHLATNDSLTPAQIVAKYIQSVHPDGPNAVLDYAVISHFHTDHYGKVTDKSSKSADKKYLLSGITEIDEYVPIQVLLDRAYPDYDEPTGLKGYYGGDNSFQNYLKFVEARKLGDKSTQRLIPGSNSQIGTKSNKYPSFKVRNLKSNLSIWTGKKDSVSTYAHDFGPLIENCGFNENPLSIALGINYGDFDYFTGGDLTGYDWRNVLDMETPLAKALGEVDATALNHHGFHDATNEFFMRELGPSVVVNQSRHTPHFQFTPLQQVVAIKADFYANNLHTEIFSLFSNELKNLVKGMNGHIVIRVLPGGGKYDMYLIDDDDFELKIIHKIGPYMSRK